MTGTCDPMKIYGFTAERIDDMRRHLAKQWRVSLNQVTDSEAAHQLREDVKFAAGRR